jgi:hypothetical protein
MKERDMNRTASIAILAALVSGPAFAQTTDEDVVVVEEEDVEVVEVETTEMDAQMADMIRTRDITGGPIYSTGADFYDEANWMATDPMEAEMDGGTYAFDEGYDNIGSIEDIVLDRSGQMIGIVAEIGGFLDIGDKHVMLPVEDVRLVAVDDQSYSYVTRLTEEQLEELPGVDEGPTE